jgi:hypothetical protein
MIIERPCAELVELLETSAVTLLRGAMGDAEPDLDRLRAKVAPEHWPALLAKTVDIQLGPVRRHGDITLLAFSWRATGTATLFPVLDADLEVSPLGEGRSEIALRGRYEPPGGLVGRSIDQLLLHRVADATIRAFLTCLSAALVAVPAAPSDDREASAVLPAPPGPPIQGPA